MPFVSAFWKRTYEWHFAFVPVTGTNTGTNPTDLGYRDDADHSGQDHHDDRRNRLARHVHGLHLAVQPVANAELK